MSRSKKPVNAAAANALDRMKMEVATELGISDKVRSQGWSTMTSADCGRVGGQMVKKMIAQYEASMSGSTPSNTSTLTAKYDSNN